MGEVYFLSKYCIFLLNKILSFFSSPKWTLIGNGFTLLGIISPIFICIRFLHNCKQNEWNDNIAINVYDSNYKVEISETAPIISGIWDEESPYASVIVFKPTNCVIRKLKIIQLNPETEKPLRTIKCFKNISPETPVCIKTEMADCIPQYRLRWYSDYGEYYDYDLIENSRNGINSISGVVYKKNIFTAIRKFLEWK